MHRETAEIIPRLEGHMRIDTVRKEERFITLEGQIFEPRSENVLALKNIVLGEGLTPFFENNKGSNTAPHLLKIGLFTLRKVRQRPWLNILLFVLTFITTTAGGALLSGVDVFANPLLFWRGLPYSLSIILILGSHELGHYLTCRYFGMQATPPFFIPFMPPFGTMGAVIRMGLIPSRRALIRVGAAGPIVGFLVAIPVTIVGLMLSEVVSTPATSGAVQFGESLIFQLLSLIVKGPLPQGSTVMIHPVALAGWLGFLVTALNLLPLSQLDGGHISYGLFGKNRIYLSIATYVALASVAFFFKSWNWLVWAAITLAFGFKHPPAEDEITPLKASDVLFSLAALAILILTVVPVPMQILK
ncbi:site-2 protease family protein [bacterium]|nr:site-2 protease family protein [bacterium]